MARLSRVERKDLAKESSVIFLEGGCLGFCFEEIGGEEGRMGWGARRLSRQLIALSSTGDTVSDVVPREQFESTRS